MRVRPLGKTGLHVSEMSLGTWGISGDGYGIASEVEAERVVLRAIEIGVTLIDTSDAYGGGRTEALLGRVVGAKADVKIVTRGGVDRTTEPPHRNFTAKYLREAVERSRKRLRRDCLDVYLLHGPSADTLLSGETVDALHSLKSEGKIAHWGVSAGDIDVAHAAIDKGADVLSLAYNLFQALDVHRLGGEIMVSRVGVLAHSVLGYGLLSGLWAKDKTFPEGDHRRERWSPPELERRLEQLDAVRYLVRQDVFTLRGAAVRFVLANHVVSSAILGPRSVEQLEQLVRETGAGPRYLPDEDLAALHRKLGAVGIAS